jgi:predicted RNase H-like nuclease
MESFVAGVDGRKVGWVWFKLYYSGRTESGLVNLPAVLRERPHGLSAIAIDIPIGLMDGPLTCDVVARRLLGYPRACSVFPAPCGASLAASGYVELQFSDSGASASRDRPGPLLRRFDRLTTR